MDRKKKIITLVIIGLFVVVLGVILYFVFRSQNKEYPSKPITQSSLSTTTEPITLGKTEVEKSDVYLYSVANTVMLTKVDAFVKSLNPKFEQTASDAGSYYEWTNGGDSIIYELDQNTVIFDIKQGIVWNEASLTEYSFNQFVKKYFDQDWEYTISISKKQTNGETVSYANRKIDDINIDMTLDNQQTDYLAIKDGKIVYGKIFLAELVKSDKKVPLVDSSNLSENINVKGYPKEIYPSYGSVEGSILSQIDYKSDEFVSVTKTLSNCKSTNISVVYLYKSMTQGNLTPVYKLALQCEITYKNTVYTIPAVGYVNAINPSYVSTQ